MADLATELSYGAMAALDLAPDDVRFATMSRDAMRGGATRFAAAVEAERPVRYVVPVRLPDEPGALGALILQQDRLALAWQSLTGLNQAVWSAFDADTLIYESVGHVDGEPWARYRVTDADSTWSFLVPPVRGDLLLPTLRQLLRPWLRPDPEPASEFLAAARPNVAEPPTAPMPTASAAADATTVLPATPPVAPAEQWVHRRSAQPAAVVADPPLAPTPAPLGPTRPTPRSHTLIGFLIGLVISLVVGGLWLLTQLQ